MGNAWIGTSLDGAAAPRTLGVCPLVRKSRQGALLRPRISKRADFKARVSLVKRRLTSQAGGRTGQRKLADWKLHRQSAPNATCHSGDRKSGPPEVPIS